MFTAASAISAAIGAGIARELDEEGSYAVCFLRLGLRQGMLTQLLVLGRRKRSWRPLRFSFQASGICLREDAGGRWEAVAEGRRISVLFFHRFLV